MRETNADCCTKWFNGVLVGCIIHPDELIMLFTTLNDRQALLNCCHIVILWSYCNFETSVQILLC